MNIFSAFDGMSCGQIALNNLGVKYDNYYASEIDNHAIRVTQSNFPKTIQVGDITKVDCSKLPKINVLIGGSPCQGFSFAGKQLNFDDPRSKLFFEFVRIKNELTPQYFLLENVLMDIKSQNAISELMGCEPILINSKIVSAQSRDRLYWTNMEFTRPKNKGITMSNIVESGNPLRPFCQTILATIYKENVKSMIKRKKYSYLINDNGKIRKLMPIECERLQTVPDNYTKFVSDTQRYKMIGNGWTVKIIEHFFCNLNKSAKVHQRPMSLFSHCG